jgi:glycosyltransferase involved in cell wall biosynthesis
MTAAPLISCIMPTRNRRPFVARAVRYFLRQDYPARELIVLDDGEDAVGDLIPADGRIRYKRLEQRLPLGEKRNLACRLSRGKFIAHWDDDDWSAPNRPSEQAAHLQATGAGVCGMKDLLHYRPEAEEAWIYRYPPEERPWLAGGTLLYRRSVWDDRRFPAINVGEDNAFVWSLPPALVAATPDATLFVAILHPGNTGRKNLADHRWRQTPLREILRLLGPDRDFYACLFHRDLGIYPKGDA